MPIFKLDHNTFEFFIDCGQYFEGSSVYQFHIRIITNPVGAKALLETLRESIELYEQTNGIITYS